MPAFVLGLEGLMPGWFDKILGKKQSEIPLIDAARGKDREEFRRLFLESQLYFMSVPDWARDGINVSRMSQEEFVEHIRAAATALKERESFTLFRYQKYGRSCLGLFTEMKFAEEFGKIYVEAMEKAMSFEVCGVSGALVVPALGETELVILNDLSEEAYELTKKDIELLRRP